MSDVADWCTVDCAPGHPTSCRSLCAQGHLGDASLQVARATFIDIPDFISTRYNMHAWMTFDERWGGQCTSSHQTKSKRALQPRRGARCRAPELAVTTRRGYWRLEAGARVAMGGEVIFVLFVLYGVPAPVCFVWRITKEIYNLA